MPTYSKYSGIGGGGIQSINSSTIPAQSIVGSGDVTVSTVTGTGVTTVSLGTPLSTFANTSLSNLANPTALNRVLRGQDGTAAAPAYSFTSSTGTGIYLSASNNLNLATGGSSRVDIDSSGRVLVGVNFTTARTTFLGSTLAPQLQIEGLDNNLSSMSLVNNFNGLAQVWGIYFGRARSGTIGGLGLVADDDTLGQIYFNGSTSASLRTAAQIRASVDGTPSDTAMPGKLQFYTVPANSLSVQERMRITSAGNVGINNPAPSRQLTIQNVTASQPATFAFLNTTNLAAGGGTYEAGSIEFLTNDVAGGLTAPVALSKISSIADNSASTVPGGILAFFSNQEGVNQTQLPIERMRITPTGNVGIGTTNPVSSLAVQRENAITEITNTVYGVSATNLSNLICRSAGGTVASPTAILSGDRILSLLGAGYDGTAFRNQVAVIGESSENWSGTNRGSYLRFETTANASSTRTERMRIDNAGNVGINITPNVWANVFQQRALQIGSVASLSVIDTGTGNVQTNLACNAYDFSSGPFYQVSAAASAYRQLSGSHVWYNAGTGTAGNTITFSERMRIDGAGNVGIGTASPGQRLEVSGNVLFNGGDGNSTNGNLRVIGSPANQQTYFDHYGAGGSILHGRTASGTFASPTSTLNGVSCLRLNAQGYDGTVFRSIGRIDFETFGGTSSTSSAGSIIFSTVQNNTTTLSERMRIDNAGNVGIGTTSTFSSVRLDVRGAGSNTLTDLGGQVIGSYDTAAVAQNVGGGISFGYIYTTGGDLIGRAAVIKAVKENATSGDYATSLVFGTTVNGGSTAERMRISGAGNVGIGTTTPTNRLEVQVSNSSLVTALALSNHINYASGRGVGISFRVPLDTPFTTSYAGGFIGSTSEGGSGAGNSNLIFQTASSQTLSERMRIDNAGNVGIGTASPINRLHIQQTTAATNTVTDVLLVDSQSSGTPAVGIGVGIEMACETSANNTEIGVVLEAVTNDVTAASEDFDFVVKTMANGTAAAERVKVGSNGNVTVANGNVILNTAGNSINIKEGTNARMGSVALVAGAATVATTAVGANSRIFLTSNAGGGTPGWLRVSARTNGTNFTITSSSATDTSTVAWLIIEPA